MVIEIEKDAFSPDSNAVIERFQQGQEPQTLEGRKAVALKRWEALSPDKLAYHVMFANEQLADAGKKQVRDFIVGA